MQFEAIGDLPFVQGLDARAGLAFDKDGNLYAVGNNKFWRVDPTLPSNTVGEFGQIGGEFPSRFIPSQIVIDKNGRIYGREQFSSGHTSFFEFDITDPSNPAAPYYLEIDADAMSSESRLWWVMFYNFDTEQFVSYITYSGNPPRRRIVYRHGNLDFSGVDLDTFANIAGFTGQGMTHMAFDKDGHLIVADSSFRLRILDINNFSSNDPIKFANTDILPERSKLYFNGYLKRPRNSSLSRNVLSMRLFYNGINNRFDSSFLSYPDNEQRDIGAWTGDCILKGKVCALIEYEQVEYFNSSGLTGGIEWEEFPKIEFLIKGPNTPCLLYTSPSPRDS